MTKTKILHFLVGLFCLLSLIAIAIGFGVVLIAIIASIPVLARYLVLTMVVAGVFLWPILIDLGETVLRWRRR